MSFGHRRARTPIPRARLAQGFTLLEVMVAAAILGSGLAAIATATAMGTSSTSLAVRYEEARLLAESKLALFLARRPRQAEHVGGENKDPDMAWRIRAEAEGVEKRLLRVVVEVDFFAPGGTRTLMLETREVIRALPKTTTLRLSN